MVIEDSVTLGTKLSIPTWVHAATDVELCTLRLEKRPNWKKVGSRDQHDNQISWFTCKHCPQRIRYERDFVVKTKYKNFNPGEFYLDKNLVAIDGSTIKPMPYWGIVWGDVIRCNRCNRKRSRYRRGKKTLDKIVKVWLNSDEWDRYRPKFITLTSVNDFVPFQEDGTIRDQDMADLVRSFKRKITNFRRTKAFKSKIIGGVDYIEQVYNIEDKGISVNTHSHHVWLGKFWKQDEFQKDWGHGIVRIEDCTSVRSVMKYISKYITKDDVHGVRCKETFGVIRK